LRLALEVDIRGMAIEIIPKPKIRKISLIKISYLVLVAAIAAFLVSYFVLNFYQKKMSQEISDIDKSLQKSPSEKNLEDGIFSYQKKINDVNILLSSHRLVAAFLDNLEKNIHPKVWLQKFKLNTEEKIVDVSGSADNFEILGQQTLIFEKWELVKNANLTKVSIGQDSKINFDLRLIFDPKVFQ
jgi:hypothetical protein